MSNIDMRFVGKNISEENDFALMLEQREHCKSHAEDLSPKMEAVLDDFYSDTTDEGSQCGEVLDKYYLNVDGYGPNETCFVLGLLNSCMRDDNEDEALLVISRYMNCISQYRNTLWVYDGSPAMEWDKPESVVEADNAMHVMKTVYRLLNTDQPDMVVPSAMCKSLFDEILGSYDE